MPVIFSLRIDQNFSNLKNGVLGAVKLVFDDVQVYVSVQRRHGVDYIWTSGDIFVRKSVSKALSLRNEKQMY